MPIYDKSTTQLLSEYLTTNFKPGETVDRDKIINWFSDNYPKPMYTIEEFDGDGPEPPDDTGGAQFAYESHLRDFLKDNLEIIEPGLTLYRDEEDSSIVGVEFECGGRRIDILAVDSTGTYVVIELKVSKGYERAVGQLLRYKSWVRKEMANGDPVRGESLPSLLALT
jgi:hypothetical protein